MTTTDVAEARMQGFFFIMTSTKFLNRFLKGQIETTEPSTCGISIAKRERPAPRGPHQRPPSSPFQPCHPDVSLPGMVGKQPGR